MVVFQKLEGKTTTLKFRNQKLEGKTTALNFLNQKLKEKTTTLKNGIKKNGRKFYYILPKNVF